MRLDLLYILFFFNDTATTEIYTLSLHDALPISLGDGKGGKGWYRVERSGLFLDAPNVLGDAAKAACGTRYRTRPLDRKSTRLNSSHANISYAVFCLKKKKKNKWQPVRAVERKMS